jgi:hypothetical protein
MSSESNTDRLKLRKESKNETPKTSRNDDVLDLDNSEVNSDFIDLAGTDSAVLQAVVLGKDSFEQILEVAKEEFKCDGLEASKKVIRIINGWNRVKSSTCKKVNDSQGDLNKNLNLSVSSNPLDTPEVELSHFQKGSQGGQDLETFKRKIRKSRKKDPAYFLPGDEVNDTEMLMSDDEEVSMDGEEEAIGDDERTERIPLIHKDSKRRLRGVGRSVISLEQMTEGQRLARETIGREILEDPRDSSALSVWDPLAFTISEEKKETLIKEVEAEPVFFPSPGKFTLPIKGSGQASWAKDNALYGLMNDTNVLVRGMTQTIALCLDAKPVEAVEKSAKLVALGSSVLARLNEERFRIHYPKSLANKIFRPRTEPLMRETHRQRVKESAQEVRDTSLLSSSFFRKGGRSVGERKSKRQQKRFFRSSGTSFPRQVQRNNRFGKYKKAQQPFTKDKNVPK